MFGPREMTLHDVLDNACVRDVGQQLVHDDVGTGRRPSGCAGGSE